MCSDNLFSALQTAEVDDSDDDNDDDVGFGGENGADEPSKPVSHAPSRGFAAPQKKEDDDLDIDDI